MATASTPVTPETTWQQQQQHPSATLHSTTSTSLDSNINLQRKMRAMILQQQQMALPQASSSSSRNNSTNIQELIQNLNELCYKGFDELNALIQEQRWVRNIQIRRLDQRLLMQFIRYRVWH
jgi:hypothetical protein